MKTIILSKEQIQELVTENKYKIDPKTKFLSRCIDGRYQDDKIISPLAFPGADAGELALLFATANAFGFEILEEKAYQVLANVVGGIDNLHFHTDKKHEQDPLAGCRHFSQLRQDPKAYHLEKDQLDFIEIKAKNSIMLGAQDEILMGEQLRGAVLQIKGNYNIYPNYAIETVRGTQRVEFFEFHKTLVGDRHKELAKALVKEQAVKLYNGCDEEYLYEVLSDMTDQHFFETIKLFAKNLFLYEITFQDNGDFTIEEMGKV